MIGVAISAPPVFVAWVLAAFEIPPCIFVIVLVSVGVHVWSHNLFLFLFLISDLRFLGLLDS